MRPLQLLQLLQLQLLLLMLRDQADRMPRAWDFASAVCCHHGQLPDGELHAGGASQAPVGATAASACRLAGSASAGAAGRLTRRWRESGPRGSRAQSGGQLPRHQLVAQHSRQPGRTTKCIDQRQQLEPAATATVSIRTHGLIIVYHAETNLSGMNIKQYMFEPRCGNMF